ncbi:MAG: hypothetical protein QNK37_08965 [Acidobacteriota bacterium]|nr:hypothetical protein [Acidobacteriota bacterium]
MNTRFVWIILLAACTTGCLDQEIEQTLYLENDGTASWVLKIENHQDSDPAEDRKNHIQALERLEAGNDDFEKIMMETGAVNIETRILRRRSPMVYQISGVLYQVTDLLALLLEETPVFWEAEDVDGGTILRFEVVPEAGNGDVHPLKLVVVGGSIYRGERDLGSRVHLQQLEDWHGLEVFHPHP